MAADDFTPQDAKLMGAVEAALASGNMEAANEIASILKQNRLRNTPLPPPVQVGQAGMPDAIKSTVRDQYGVGAQRLAGAGSAPMIAGHAVGQLAGANNAADLQNWQALSKSTPDTQMGNIAGNVGMFVMAPPGAAGAAMGAAGRTLPRLGTVADIAATQGALNYITTPGDVGDRAVAAGMGVAGAGAPAAMGAVQGARRMATTPGARLDLAEGLRREMGPDSEALTAALRGTYPASRFGVQPTAAMLTKNPTLEVLETGSRVRTPDQWTNFDRTNATARWRALEDAAGTPQELEKLRAARDAITGPMRESALQATGGALKVGKGTAYGDLQETLGNFATGASRPNRDVQTLVNYVKSEFAQGVTPEQVYTVRKMLTDGIKAGPTSELSQAARAARPERMEIIGALDKILDDVSGGKWGKYLETYKISSPLINSRQALLNMTDELKYGRPVGDVPASLGERPAPYSFGRLLEKHGTKQFGSKDIDQLIPQHRQLASTLLSDLNTQAGVMQPRATLGSPTAGNLSNAGRVSQLTNSILDAAGNVIPYGGSTVAASVKGSMARKAEEALSELLKNPQLLAEELRRAKTAQELLINSGRAGAGTSAALRGRE